MCRQQQRFFPEAAFVFLEEGRGRVLSLEQIYNSRKQKIQENQFICMWILNIKKLGIDTIYLTKSCLRKYVLFNTCTIIWWPREHKNQGNEILGAIIAKAINEPEGSDLGF